MPAPGANRSHDSCGNDVGTTLSVAQLSATCTLGVSRGVVDLILSSNESFNGVHFCRIVVSSCSLCLRAVSGEGVCEMLKSCALSRRRFRRKIVFLAAEARERLTDLMTLSSVR